MADTDKPPIQAMQDQFSAMQNQLGQQTFGPQEWERRKAQRRRRAKMTRLGEIGGKVVAVLIFAAVAWVLILGLVFLTRLVFGW